jgi:hypothetical protein
MQSWLAAYTEYRQRYNLEQFGGRVPRRQVERKPHRRGRRGVERVEEAGQEGSAGASGEAAWLRLRRGLTAAASAQGCLQGRGVNSCARVWNI